jgi:hypothetical protein
MSFLDADLWTIFQRLFVRNLTRAFALKQEQAFALRLSG